MCVRRRVHGCVFLHMYRGGSQEPKSSVYTGKLGVGSYLEKDMVTNKYLMWLELKQRSEHSGVGFSQKGLF